MRIISGKYKSRIIKMPKGIRPTQDKIRKALFDILGGIEGLSFLELFAGSGAVGLEALSRGASDITLVEYNRECLKAIKKNIELLKVTSCRVYLKDANEAIKNLHKDGKKFDIIFLDPPYHPEYSYSNAESRVSSKYYFGIPKHLKRSRSIRKGHLFGIPARYRVSSFIRDEDLSKKTLQTLSRYDILTPNGLIIIQHYKKEKLDQSVGNLRLQRQARYGDTVLSFYNEKGQV